MTESRTETVFPQANRLSPDLTDTDRRQLLRAALALRRHARTFGPDTTEAVRQLCPIEKIVSEHVKLRRSGSELVGRCPFHDDRTPSLSVNPDKQLFFCHGCGIGGDVFRFIERLHSFSFPEAVKLLACGVGINIDDFEPSTELSVAVATRKKEREEEQLFSKWLDVIEKVISDELIRITMIAQYAKRTLAIFPEDDQAWIELANFYHAEAGLMGALDFLASEKASVWLEEPMTKKKLFVAFTEASDRVRDGA